VSTPKASLKPHLAEIRAWVAEGRTDIWIAHHLGSTPASISAFRSAHGVLRRNNPAEASGTSIPPPVIPPDAKPLPAPEKPRRRRRARAGGDAKPAAPAAGGRRRGAAAPDVVAAEATPARAGDGAASDGGATPRRRRRRGGRGRRAAHTFEAVLDRGDEGYGFWLDGAVRDDGVFAEHWSGRRALIVKIEADQIVVRPDERAESAAPEDAGGA
jgi:hypothetical protein